MISTLGLLLILAADPVPFISHQTLAKHEACRKAVDPERGRQAITDDVVRKCGFTSSAQLARFEMRLLVASLDAADESATSKPMPTLESLEKQWREDPEMTDAELARRREVFRSVEAIDREMRERIARRKTTKQASLASSGHFEDAERASLKKDAEGQPPLTDAERKAFAERAKTK